MKKTIESGFVWISNIGRICIINFHDNTKKLGRVKRLAETRPTAAGQVNCAWDETNMRKSLSRPIPMEEQRHRPGIYISCLIACVRLRLACLWCAPGPPGQPVGWGSPSPADEGSGVCGARASSEGPQYEFSCWLGQPVCLCERPTARLSPLESAASAPAAGFCRSTRGQNMWGPSWRPFPGTNQNQQPVPNCVRLDRDPAALACDMLNCTSGAECILHEHNNPHHHHHLPHALHQSAVVVGQEASCECCFYLLPSFPLNCISLKYQGCINAWPWFWFNNSIPLGGWVDLLWYNSRELWLNRNGS